MNSIQETLQQLRAITEQGKAKVYSFRSDLYNIHYLEKTDIVSHSGLRMEFELGVFVLFNDALSQLSHSASWELHTEEEYGIQLGVWSKAMGYSLGFNK